MKRLAVFSLLAALTGVFFLTPMRPATAATANAEPVKNTFKNIPIAGTVAGGGTFEGTLDITHFEAEGDQQLSAHGKLSGVLKGLPNGQTREVRNQAVKWPVKSINGKELPQKGAAMGSDDAAADLLAKLDGASQEGLQQTCPILNLVLGPLDLNLLGLHVTLNEVNLVIEAIAGAGALLGNLLCAIAGLLDPGGTLTGLLGQLAGLLNQIIGILG
jgi:hypothetical protein